MRLRSRPAIAVGMSLAALTLGLVPAVPGAHAVTSVAARVPCNTAALVKAIDDANATPMTPTTLDLARHCTYRLTAIDNTSENGPNGLPVIVNQQLTINGHDAVVKRIATAPRFRILEVRGGSHLTLNDVTITGGDGSDGSVAGGILNGGTLAVSDSRISGNTFTPSSGNAVGVGITNNAGATLTLSSVTITGNTGRGRFASGGGLHNSGTATVSNSVISANTETASLLANGGGIDNEGHMVLSDSRVTDNILRGGPGANGGGISNDFGTLTVIHSRVSDNSATAPNNGARALGGGVNNGNVLIVQSSSIDDNTATATGQGGFAEGGGIISTGFQGAPFSSATLERTEVEGNAARCSGVGCVAAGGGVADSGRFVLADHSSVSKNAVTARGADGQALGGGTFNFFGTLSVADHGSISKNTVTASDADGRAQGGGIWNADSGTISLQGGSDVTKNTARALAGTADGGGIFNAAKNSDVAIGESVVEKNKPNNCAGPGTPIEGCTG